jgi:hypothetical protein
MQAFTGSEPLVGEVVGLRTFRVDESGLLLPLYSSLTWYDGANTATCAPPTGERPRADHVVPSPGCECGFYAYGTERAAQRNRHMRYVQAVVSCWGEVVAGTHGVRSQHARIDALWLHPNVPAWVRHRVAQRYPSARLYADRGLMLEEHPLSLLDCYAEPTRHRLPQRPLLWAALAASLGLGLVPASTLQTARILWWTWLAAAALLAVLTGWLLVGARTVGHRAAALLSLGVLAWLVAPVLGWPGWLLRLPLLRAALVVTGGYLMSLRPGFFPIDRAPRERTFCGVRA